jgi:hypothetical protein
MKNFITNNTLYLVTTLGVIVAIFTFANWSEMAVSQRLVGIFFIGLILHLWEEGKFPGGFTDMITKSLNFTQSNPHFGEDITVIYVLIITFVPLFFPNVIFLGMAPMILGILELFAHLAGIKLSGSDRFYSPGLVTAALVLVPISVYSIVYAVQNNLMSSISWLFSFLYMLFGLLMAQQIVVRTSGMKYSDFLKNVRTALFAKK